MLQTIHSTTHQRLATDMTTLVPMHPQLIFPLPRNRQVRKLVYDRSAAHRRLLGPFCVCTAPRRLRKIPCRVLFLGLHRPLIRLELSPPTELDASASGLETPHGRRAPLSLAIRSRHVVRQPPNAFQVAIGKPKIHQIPPMLSDASAVPQKRFEKLIEGTMLPMWA